MPILEVIVGSKLNVGVDSLEVLYNTYSVLKYNSASQHKKKVLFKFQIDRCK